MNNRKNGKVHNKINFLFDPPILILTGKKLSFNEKNKL